jgi:tetratricopeptide (TPR) repeat protein
MSIAKRYCGRELFSQKEKAELRKAISRDPTNGWLWGELSYIYFEERQSEKSLKAAQRAIALAPNNSAIMWDYGRALYLARRTRESLEMYRKILKKAPKVISAETGFSISKARDLQNSCRYEIALCYLQFDKLASATKWLQTHLANRVSGIRNYYCARGVKKKLRQIRNLQKKIQNAEARVWISLLEIEDLRKNRRRKYRRGFTNALVMARSKSEAMVCLRKALTELGYRLISSEGTEEFERRCLKSKVDDELRKLATVVLQKNTPQFGRFCMYPSRKQSQ